MDVTIKRKGSGNLMAIADISLETVEFGKVVIKNFQIWKSEKYNDRLKAHANITPPSINIGVKKYYKLAYFDNPAGWESVEFHIWNEYINDKYSEKND